MRMSLPFHHLLAAAKIAREIAAIETANQDAPFGSFYDDILGASVGCVVLSAAAAEADVNEVFADRERHFSAHDRGVLDLLWNAYEQKSVIEKYELALKLRGGAALDNGARWVQSLARLLKLRNALIHFKPEWDDEQVEQVRLGKKLEGYVSRSPWFPGEPLFPRAWATAGTASWSVTTVVEFIRRFAELAGIPDRLAKFRERLVVPAR